MKYLGKTDKKILQLIKAEKKRQAETLMMIPSENMVSKAVEEAVGSCLGNKYAEGYPFKRYYQGQKYVDQIESLVIERAKKAFKTPHANVQPLSGSPANLAVYLALLKPKDKIMGLALDHGGHLTHGFKVSASGIFFNSVSYTLGKNGKMDYKVIEKMALKERPKIIVAGITAYPLQLDWKKFASIAKKVNAYLLADISHLAGLVLGGVYPSPVPYVDIVTTTTHKTLRGPRGAIIMATDKGICQFPELTRRIDKAVFPGLQGGPHMNAIAGIGVALQEAQTPSFKKYAKQIVENSKTLARELKKYDFDLVAGGSNTHLILIDLQNKKILGNLAAEALEEAGIVLNRNPVPFDPNPPFYPSGIRLGTPGITSRGMKEKEMVKIGEWIKRVIDSIQYSGNSIPACRSSACAGRQYSGMRKKSVRKEIIEKCKEIKKVRKEVRELCRKFPVKDSY